MTGPVVDRRAALRASRAGVGVVALGGVLVGDATWRSTGPSGLVRPVIGEPVAFVPRAAVGGGVR